MLRKYKITYIALSGRQRELTVEATSKYNAKQKFYFQYPKYEIVKVEEVTDEQRKAD